MRQIIKNGTIVTGSGSFPADILIDGEKIAATGTAEEIKKLAQPGDKEIDVSGCLIFPGFIDAHTHFDLHVAGTVTADDFVTGTKAALRGGTTTIIDFGTQYPGETLAEGLKNWHEKADGKLVHRELSYRFLSGIPVAAQSMSHLTRNRSVTGFSGKICRNMTQNPNSIHAGMGNQPDLFRRDHGCDGEILRSGRGRKRADFFDG